MKNFKINKDFNFHFHKDHHRLKKNILNSNFKKNELKTKLYLPDFWKKYDDLL